MEVKGSMDLSKVKDLVMEGTYGNMEEWVRYEAVLPEWARESLRELIEGGEVEELDNRFYKELKFGTGGIRSRTIGKKATKAEMGADGEPLHAGVGSNYLNDFNVVRATVGLYRYSEGYLRGMGRKERPRLVVSYDVRYFSRHFAGLVADVWGLLGGEAWVYREPRSTPQLSFSVRYKKAVAGVMITASHNPFHDNGFKAYFEDGGQMVNPHAEGVIGEYGRVGLGEVIKLLGGVKGGGYGYLGKDMDEAYWEEVMSGVIDKEALRKGGVKVVYTGLHGVGGRALEPLFSRAGVEVEYVKEQMVEDGRFRTVESPNPENSGALEMGIKLGEKVGGEVVFGTDPDADRMGVAVKERGGGWRLLSGNQVGAILTAYRLERMKEKGIYNEENAKRVVLLKTFVTTPLIEKVGEGYGVHCVNTLTGFKWIGRKIEKYERELREQVGEGVYGKAKEEGRLRELELMKGKYFVFGGEESYGYLGTEGVRDKDGNGAVMQMVEVVNYLKGKKVNLIEYLDELYGKYGYYEEGMINIYYEGASGAAKIEKLLRSYRERGLELGGGFKVKEMKDFERDEVIDEDGEVVPKELFFMVYFDNGYRLGIRGSGTEPKIKYYLFGRGEGEGLEGVKREVKGKMEGLKKLVREDAEERVKA